MRIIKPTPYWEFPVAHLVNFIIYLFALGCFHFLLSELVAYQQRREARLAREGSAVFTPFAWFTLGYGLFIWSSLALIKVSTVTPDMCVAAFAYLASGLLLRIRNGSGSWKTFAFLGIVLGLGYLAKAVMFPLALPFLGTAALWARGWDKAISSGLVSLACFALVAGPFVAALSSKKERPTFGDTGKLNYSTDHHRVPLRHWQGEKSEAVGIPENPTRMIFGDPPVYEFAWPIGGTYPPWYDPSYWNEGMSPSFNPKTQAKIFVSNLVAYFRLLTGSQAPWVTAFLIILFVAGRGLSFSDFTEQSHLLLPALAGLGIYSLVHIHSRFIGGFVVLLWLGIASAVRLRKSPESIRLVNIAAIVLLVTLTLRVSVLTAAESYAKAAAGHVHWEIAEALRQAGIEPGDPVGIIMSRETKGFYAYWARLARVRIVAEIQAADTKEFLTADDKTKSQVMETFASAGAKAVVADELSSLFVEDGWEKLGRTKYFVYRLTKQ